MTPKELLTNKSFCPLPWTGFHIDPAGTVKNCICSFEEIGSILDNSIEEVLKGPKNTQVKQEILKDTKPYTCSYCYGLEKNKKSHSIVSSRVYYLKELKDVDRNLYDNPTNFDLHHIDIRWSNTCNFACVYCGPTLSSKWASELNIKVPQPTQERFDQLKKYVFDHAHQLKNVYLAGGEPLLTKDNEEFLEILLEKNPAVELRVNTNLSKTNTRVLDLICQFKNVHWTVSVESMKEEFEYMRYGGKWSEFLENLERIRYLPHKLTFNMVWCILNYNSIFDTIDHFIDNGFHQNSFILTAIYGPGWLDSRNLPDNVLKLLTTKLENKINQHPGYLLEDGYKNLLAHIQQPFEKNLTGSFEKLKQIDQRRGIDSSKIFTELHKLREEN
jgi:sulfatase maturation enzyme AslB (radical SAM superfamily)